MNYLKKQAAVKKHSEQFKTDPGAVKEALSLDYEPDEAKEILAALSEPEKVNDNEKPSLSKEHKHYTWFDEFDAKIQKKEVRNRYTQQIDSIITGWQLEKKKHPKLIERHNATYLNSFADGYDIVGSLLVPKDEYKTGDVLPYENWAKEQGKDLKNDKNIFLNN